MPSIYRNLPPLSSLKAFEAAARYQNFTKAADELCLTQSAVSRHVRALEDSLGVELFEREHRAVKLTPDGRRLMDAVSMGLSHISMVTQDIRDSHGTGKLTVGMMTAYASIFIMPRISGFRKLFPEFELHIVSLERNPNIYNDDLDVAIVLGHTQTPGFESTLLFNEQAYPVCSRDYLEQSGPLATPADLPNHALLHLDDTIWDGCPWPSPINWRNWLAEFDVSLPLKPNGLDFNSYDMVVHAALQGLGVAIGWHHLVSDYIKAGDLVRPMEESCHWERGHYLVYPSNLKSRPDVQAFCGWLKTETENTVCAI